MRHSPKRRNRRDNRPRGHCIRCGIAFEVHGNKEPELCDGCLEDLAEEDDNTDDDSHDAMLDWPPDWLK